LHDAFDRQFAADPVDDLPTAVSPVTDLSG